MFRRVGFTTSASPLMSQMIHDTYCRAICRMTRSLLVSSYGNHKKAVNLVEGPWPGSTGHFPQRVVLVVASFCIQVERISQTD